MIITVIISFVLSSVSVASGSTEIDDGHLIVTGWVEKPLDLTISEITALPQTTIYAEIHCVDFPSQIVEQGNWTGVRLWRLLEEAGVLPQAVKVAFYATDGFMTDLKIETAQREDIIVAYQRDGLPLSEGLRLVTPGKWGYKWIKQINKIELVDYDFLGTWESRGYSDDADMTEGTSNKISSFNPNEVLPSGASPAPTPDSTQSPEPDKTAIPTIDQNPPSENSPKQEQEVAAAANSNMIIENIFTVTIGLSVLIITTILLLAYITKNKRKVAAQ